MTQPPNNPSNEQTADKTGSALRLARVLIALGLLVGVGVFGVYTIESLKAGVATSPRPMDFGASSEPPSLTSHRGGGPLAGLTGTDPNKFIPIMRANPHPGQIPPFRNAAPYGQPPYRQPSAGGEVWEFCVYQVSDASLEELMAHYSQQAMLRGMRLINSRPTDTYRPGGVASSWSNGEDRLEVTATPLPVTEPVQPPLAPPTPLRWVVKYSYPDLPTTP